VINPVTKRGGQFVIEDLGQPIEFDVTGFGKSAGQAACISAVTSVRQLSVEASL
jgi:hypothetical protein